MEWLEIAKRAAAGFGIEPVSAQPLEGGRINLNLKVETTTVPYVLRLYPHTRTSEQVRFEMNVLQHLHAQGVRVPEPLSREDGEKVATLDGAPLAWLHIVPGDPHSPDEGLALPVDDVLSLIGDLRRGLASFEAPFEAVQETRTFAHDFRRVFKSLQDAGRPSLASELRDRFHDAERWEREAQLPTGVIHADLHAGNILSEGDGPLWLVDFDDAHVSWRALDWVLPALELSIDAQGGFDAPRYDALLDPWRNDPTTLDEERRAEADLASLLLLKRACTQHLLGCPLTSNRYLMALLQDEG